MNNSLRRMWLLLAVLWTAGLMADILPKPKEYDYVFDYAGLMRDSEKQNIRTLGQAVEKACGAQLIVVVAADLDGGELDGYANDLFNSWGIGDAKKNNGVLLLVNGKAAVAGQTGRVRIEVGDGLEGALPDGKCGRILDELVLPPWEEKKYGKGIVDGYIALVRTVCEEYLVSLPPEITEQYDVSPWVPVPERPADMDYVYDFANIFKNAFDNGPQDGEGKDAPIDYAEKMRQMGQEIFEKSGVRMVMVTLDDKEHDMARIARSIMYKWGMLGEGASPTLLILVNKAFLEKTETNTGEHLLYSDDVVAKAGKWDTLHHKLIYYGKDDWKEGDYARGAYRGYIAIADAIKIKNTLTLSEENEEQISALTSWWDVVQGVFGGCVCCVLVVVLYLTGGIGVGGSGGGRGGRGGGFGGSFGGSFGGGHSSGGGASR